MQVTMRTPVAQKGQTSVAVNAWPDRPASVIDRVREPHLPVELREKQS
jgi:hypothetical protein